jgi:hypothetical protein
MRVSFRLGSAELARQTVERLAAQHAEDRLRLPPGREPPGLTQPIGVRGHRRARESLPISLAFPHVHLLGGASSLPARLSTKIQGERQPR